MNVAKPIAAGVCVGATPFIWLAAVSFIYCMLSGHTELYVFPFIQWLVDFPVWKKTLRLTFLIWVSPVVPTFVLLTLICGVAKNFNRSLARPLWGGQRPQERGVTTNHSIARWATVKEMKRMFPGPHPVYGGTVVGEAYRVDESRVADVAFDPTDPKTWGKGGTAPLLIDPCTRGPTHCAIISGSGWYKSQVAATQVMAWRGSKVILDPSCELGPMTEEALKARGERVFQIKTVPGCGMDSLDWIDIRHEEAEMHVQEIVSAIYDEVAVQKNSDPLFTPMGRNLVTCLLASLLWDAKPGEPKTLAVLNDGLKSLSEKEFPLLLRKIYDETKSSLARKRAVTLMEMGAPQTFSGVYVNATTGTSWLDVGSYANVVSDGLCKPSDILGDGPTTIFLQIPLSALDKAPGIARVLIAALVNRVVLEDGNVPGRILFLIDEAARLGSMKIIEVVRDAGRKYGITLMMLYQAVSQMKEQWGPNALDKWQQSTSWMGYAAVASDDALKAVSEACGTHGVMAYSEGDNRGRQATLGRGWGSRSRGHNTNVHEIRRALITTDELRLLRADETIVLPAGGRPVRCGRAIWFRRPDLQRIIKPSRFVRRD